MPDVDKELATSLQQTKQQPRNFAIIAKGSTILKLLVSKKPIPESALTAAKHEFQGNTVIRGVVSGAAWPDLMFQVVEAPSFGHVKLRTFLMDQAQLSVKPQFQVVPQVREIEPQDDAGANERRTGAERLAPPPPDASPPQTVSATPPQQPVGAGAPTIREQPAALVTERIKTLLPAIKQALDENARGGQEARTLVAEAGELTKNGQFDQAHALLDHVAKLLRPERPTAHPGVAAARQFATRRDAARENLAALAPVLDEVARVARTYAADRVRQATPVAGPWTDAAKAFAQQRSRAAALLDELAQSLTATDRLAASFSQASNPS